MPRSKSDIMTPKGLPELPQGFDGHGLGAAFNLIDANRVKIGTFGQLFLSESGSLAEVGMLYTGYSPINKRQNPQ